MKDERQMNGPPYYKAYPRDFIEGTVGMPFEVKGAYRIVLDLIYMHGGKLPDDARYVSGVLGCSVRKWNAIREILVSGGKLQIISGFLTNYRAVIELETLRSLQDKQRENRSRLNKIKDLQSPRCDQPEPESEPDIRSGGGMARARKFDGTTTRERILLECGVEPISGLTGKGGRMLGTRADMDRVRRWQEELGLDEETIVSVISETMAPSETAIRGDHCSSNPSTICSCAAQGESC